MLQIKTIIHADTDGFDAEVNLAIAEGWELVKRDVLPPYESHGTAYLRTYYAELEREVEEDEEEIEVDGVAQWRISRNPRTPYKCSACGAECEDPLKFCPRCGRGMVEREAQR